MNICKYLPVSLVPNTKYVLEINNHIATFVAKQLFALILLIDYARNLNSKILKTNATHHH